MSTLQRSRYLLRACSSLVRGYQNRSISYKLLRVNPAQRRDIQRYSVQANQDNVKEDVKNTSSQSAAANSNDSAHSGETDQSEMEDLSVVVNAGLGEKTSVKPSDNNPVQSQLRKLYYILGGDLDLREKDFEFGINLKKMLELMERMNEKETDGLVDQKLYDRIEAFVGSKVGKMYFLTLVHLLKFILKLHRDDTELLKTLLHEAVWRSRSTPLRDTTTLLSVVEHDHKTPKRDELYKMCRTRLSQQLDEIEDPKLLISTMYHIQTPDTAETKQQLDQLALKFVDNMTPVQIYRVIYLMAKNRARNIVLLKRAAYQLCKRPLNFNEVKLKNLFYACEVLNLQQDELLEDMSVNLVDKLANDTGDKRLTVSLPVLTSLSKLGWSYRALTQSIMEDLQRAIKVDRSSVTSVQKAGLIVSLGSLDLSDYAKFALEVFESIGDLKASDPGLWLNVVYSLALLKQAPVMSIQEVLQPIFYISLLENIKDKPMFQQAAVMTKLLHLSGCVQLELGAGNGLQPQEVDKFLSSLHDTVKSKPPKVLVEDVASALTNLAPLEKYVNRNVIDRHGHKIDFEFYVDKRGKAKRLENSAGMTKIGVRVLDFQEMIRGNKEPRPNGAALMSIRHLTAGDHCIITVSYHVWSQYKTNIAQTQYLEQLIQKAVGVEQNLSAGSTATAESTD